jgi:hypothetical protein
MKLPVFVLRLALKTRIFQFCKNRNSKDKVSVQKVRQLEEYFKNKFFIPVTSQ